MPFIVIFAATVCAIAVVLVGAIWMLISALSFYIVVAVLAYVAWRIGRSEAKRNQYLDNHAQWNRRLNDQEFAAWREEVERGRRDAKR